MKATYKESDAHVLVVEDFLGITAFELLISTTLIYNKGATYLDQLDDLGERMGISKQLLPNRPILSSLSTIDILEFFDNILSGGP